MSEMSTKWQEASVNKDVIVRNDKSEEGGEACEKEEQGYRHARLTSFVKPFRHKSLCLQLQDPNSKRSRDAARRNENHAREVQQRRRRHSGKKA